MRILIADDHPVLRSGVRRVLESAGFDVVAEAQTGPEVLPLVGRLEPDVVLVDMRMPGLDGLGCIERVKARHPDTKVIVLSVDDEADRIQGAFRRGACGYILKSIDPQGLVSAIRQATDGTAFHALGLPAFDDSVAHDAGLSERELEILRLVGRGLANREIAKELWVTEATVKFHLTRIYRKLGVTSRTAAARWAFAKGLADGGAGAAA